MESSPDDSHIIEKVQGRATKLISSFILMKGYPCLIYPTYNIVYTVGLNRNFLLYTQATLEPRAVVVFQQSME